MSMVLASHAPPLWAVTPFLGLLLSIALLPLIRATRHWWEDNRSRLLVSMFFAALTLGYYFFAAGLHAVQHTLHHAILDEYIPFIVLLFALYVISGGISLQGDLPAHPPTNTAFLALGSVLANLIGTTGASMLLIRPLLQTNSERRHVRHTVIFFIFLVSNIGGTLLPIGDPPLFLGYLRGVPFFWTARLVIPWLVTVVMLLVIYYLVDMYYYRHETPGALTRDEAVLRPLHLSGGINFLWLIGVVAAVATIRHGERVFGLPLTDMPYFRELVMLALVAVSLICTPRHVREQNRFHYGPIIEVAVLFAGIFICMQPPIEILRGAGESLARVIHQPWHFFWATGILSSFLDNAPTYVVFFESAVAITPPETTAQIVVTDGGQVLNSLLRAVSLGAVFMGAMTYIGNGPNFMVKSIAEQNRVPMPGFFGYMIYSCTILVPIFALLTWLFLI